jgi:hypothetical protein
MRDTLNSSAADPSGKPAASPWARPPAVTISVMRAGSFILL